MSKTPQENLYTLNCIRTVTGKYVNVFDPDPETICIEDIAHSLSMQCRFGGHLPDFYSVAQHSMNCAYLIVDDNQKLSALMHDASEAYLIDVPRPVKLGLYNYKGIENRLMEVIAEKFGFHYPLSQEIKSVDERMLQAEWHHLMLGNDPWELPVKDQIETKKRFIKDFELYTKLYSI